MKEQLKKILGNNALNNDMQIDNDVKKLAKSANYMHTQLMIIQKDCKTEDEKLYISDVIRTACTILED